MKSHAASMIDRQQEVSRAEVKYLTLVLHREGLLGVSFERTVPVLNRSRLTVCVPRGTRLEDVRKFMVKSKWDHHYEAWLAASGQRHVDNGSIRP